VTFGLSQSTIAILHKIFKRYTGLEKVILYGSRAKGNYKTGSDIDLTLVGEALSLDDMMNIKRDLDDSSLPYMVDVSLFHQLDNESLRDHIQRVGVVFYERTSFDSPPAEGWQAKPDGVVAGTKGMITASTPADTNHPAPAGHPSVGGKKERHSPAPQV
jgi:predicted nucleotidyltransferase